MNRRKATTVLNYRFLINRAYHPRATLNSGVQTPGKTSIILKSVSPNTSKQSLETALNDVKFKRLQLQPGCSIYFKNLAEAEAAANVLQNGMKSSVVNITLPSVSIHNISSAQSIGQFLTEDRLKSSLNVVVSGAEEIIIKAKNSLEVVKAYNQLKQFSDVKFGLNANKDGNYLIKLFGSFNVETVSNSLKQAGLQLETLQAPKAIDTTRLSANFNEKRAELLSQKLPSDGSLKVVKLPKPVVFIRNIKAWQGDTLDKLLHPFSFERVQQLRATKDGFPEQAVVYFANEKDARLCYAKLKGLKVDGTAVSVSFKEVAAPGVEIKNLPSDATEQSVRDLLRGMQVVSVELENQESSSDAFVVLSAPNEVDLAQLALDGKAVGNHVVKVVDSGVYDLGIQCDTAKSAQMIQFLESVDYKTKGRTSDSGVKVNIAFETIQEARDMIKFLENTSFSSNEEFKFELSTLPSGVVEIHDLDENTPPSAALAGLKQQLPEIEPLRTERFALLKMNKHREVVPTLKKLKSVQVDGTNISAEKFRPIAAAPASDYDVDMGALHNVRMQSLYDSEIAFSAGHRYRVVRNRFERALNDAKISKEGSNLLGEYLPQQAIEEATSLLTRLSIDSNAENRLFELFTQRGDILELSSDFSNLELLYGKADSTDPFNWAYAKIEDSEDVQRYQTLFSDKDRKEKEDQALADEKSKEQAVQEKVIAMENIDEETDEENDVLPLVEDVPSKLVLTGDDGKDVMISLEDPSRLKDQHGNMWAGAILDTDSVQKTMPGQRINTSRALVVVGNLRGTAGFGMGKGKTGADAINSAFRAALRNLTHVDLYDNFGLAHDLYGKHNSCHCYIRATPKSRLMVASPFASAILDRFGISSASVKLVGRRNPYSMVRSIFSALEEHQNIDEYAKARGKKYLTLKWARENGL